MKNSQIPLETTNRAGARVDTRVLAEQLRDQHARLMAIVAKYANEFSFFGDVIFQNVNRMPGQQERFALLNESHALLLLSKSSHDEQRRLFVKEQLVQAFREARRIDDLRQEEYLPTYRQLHDELHTLAAESRNEMFVHMNVNKLVNKVAGVKAGQRANAPLQQQSMLIVAQCVATRALRGAANHHVGYKRIKHSLEALHAVTLPETSDTATNQRTSNSAKAGT